MQKSSQNRVRAHWVDDPEAFRPLPPTDPLVKRNLRAVGILLAGGEWVRGVKC